MKFYQNAEGLKRIYEDTLKEGGPIYLVSDYERLVEGNVAFISPPQTTRDGMAEVATCIDPDGTLIELIQVHLDKWTV